jgi:hypothetical protein
MIGADTIDSQKSEDYDNRQITVNAVSNNQTVANATANILLSHR